MKTTAFKDFSFSAAHHLAIPGHACSVMHGHNYKVRVECSGRIDENGMVVDFDRIKEAVSPIIQQLDHKFLNEVIETSTTSENICAWIASKADAELGCVTRVTLWETDGCGAIVEFFTP